MDTKKLWDRLESLEDLLIRMSVYGLFPANRDGEAENAALANYRNIHPYQEGNPEHFKQNTPS